MRSSLISRCARAWFGILALALLFIPAGDAVAGPAWSHARLPPLTLGMAEVHEPASVTYRGETYVALTVDARQIVVRRLDRSHQLWPAWLSVGGPLSRRLSDHVGEPVLHVTPDDELHVAWVEQSPNGLRREIVTARLRGDPEHPAHWELVGGDAMVVGSTPSFADVAPSFVDVGEQLWLVYRTSRDQVRLVELVVRGASPPAWRLSSVVVPGSLETFDGAVGYGGSIYVLTRVEYRVYESDDDPPDQRLDEPEYRKFVGLAIDRVVVANRHLPGAVRVAERHARAVEAGEATHVHIDGARIATGGGGRPVITWDTEGGPLRLEELAPDGGRFVELRAIPIQVTGDVALAADADGVMVGVPTVEDPVGGQAPRAGLRMLEIPRDPAHPIGRGPLLALDDAYNTTLSIRPGHDTLVILPQDEHLSSHLLTRSRRAVAHGRAMINDCDPTCAAGSMTDQGVFRVTQYRLRPGTCNGEQVRMYTRARVVWPVAAKLDPETARLRKRCGW